MLLPPLQCAALYSDDHGVGFLSCEVLVNVKFEVTFPAIENNSCYFCLWPSSESRSSSIHL